MPVTWSRTCPFLKINSVGMARMLNLKDRLWFSSTFTLPTLTEPAFSRAISSISGAVKVESGCVLDIFIGAGFGGSGRILMRAVFLANGVVGGAAGAGAAAGEAGAPAAAPMGRGTGVLAAGSEGGGTAAGGGGGGAN